MNKFQKDELIGLFNDFVNSQFDAQVRFQFLNSLRDYLIAEFPSERHNSTEFRVYERSLDETLSIISFQLSDISSPLIEKLSSDSILDFVSFLLQVLIYKIVVDIDIRINKTPPDQINFNTIINVPEWLTDEDSKSIERQAQIFIDQYLRFASGYSIVDQLTLPILLVALEKARAISMTEYSSLVGSIHKNEIWKFFPKNKQFISYLKNELPNYVELLNQSLKDEANSSLDSYRMYGIDRYSEDYEPIYEEFAEIEPAHRNFALITLSLNPNKEDVQSHQLTPQNLQNIVAPYLTSLSNLQLIINDIEGVQSSPIVIRHINYNSPITVSFEGVAKAVAMIQEVIVPWRRKRAKKLGELDVKQKQIEIENLKAAIAEKNGQVDKTTAEAEKIIADSQILQVEASKRRIEVQKDEFNLYKERLSLALEIVSTIRPELTDAEKYVFAMKMLEPINGLTGTNVEMLAHWEPSISEAATDNEKEVK